MDILNSIFKMPRPRQGPHPDFDRFKQHVLSRQPGPVPVGELFADFEVVGAYLGEPVLNASLITGEPNHRLTLQEFYGGLRYIDQTIRFCIENDWDYAWCFSSIPFPNYAQNLAENTAELAKGRQRAWVDDNKGVIGSWTDFERYPWPQDIRSINLMSRAMAKRVPDGMKVMVIPGGVFEWTTWLMGLVPFSYALTEQPELVKAVIQKVAGIIDAVVSDLMTEANIGGIFMGDDLGFYSGTLVSPKVLRNLFLPQTRRIVERVHQAGKLFLLHSCGNLAAIMDDLCDLGIDGKHSFEDKIMPVEEVHQRWGDRIAIIGGVDINLLAIGTEDEIRKRTLEILDECGPRGGYVLGTGNSVTNYIPVKNYLTMLDEGRRWNRNHYPHSQAASF